MNWFKRKKKEQAPLLDLTEFTFMCNIKFKEGWFALKISHNNLEVETTAIDLSKEEVINPEIGDLRLYNKEISREEFLSMCDKRGMSFSIDLSEIK